MEDFDNLDNLDQSKGEKEFKLTTFSLRNRTTVFFLTFLIIVMGISAYLTLPKENFPEVEQPTIYIGTSYPGNSPVDIENLITRPIEKEVNTISDVDNIRSTSVQDHSTIIVEFTTSVDVQDALTKVKDAVDKSKNELPTDLSNDPNVFELNLSEFPIMNINLTGNYTIDQLNDYAEYLEEEIEKFREISKVEIRGVDEKEVRIMADPFKMEARSVNFSDIENAVRAENITQSGGSMKTNGIRRDIRIVGEFSDYTDLEEVVIKNDEGNIVYLKDVASVAFTYKEKESFARLDGNPVVMVDVIKRQGENLILLTEKIYEVIEKAKSDVFPKDLNVIISNDQSQYTRDMVSSLENNIISGVILVVLVLLFFLGSRNALFVGVAIPLSMFTAFMILGAFGITINMMVLFSLIMALGMLVDNGIVIVENVYRLMEEGENAWNATRKGVGEVAMPVIASTATTLAAFLPLAFWPGIMGDFMKYLPITLIITLGSSLFVALIINPVLIATFMKVTGENKAKKRRPVMVAIFFAICGAIVLGLGYYLYSQKPEGLEGQFHISTAFFVLGNLSLLVALITFLNIFVLTPLSISFQKKVLPGLERWYSRSVQFALAGWKPWFFFWGTVLLLFGSIGLLTKFAPEVIYFPENEPKYINVFVEYPIGTDIETTYAKTVEIEKEVFKLMDPYQFMIESIISNVGEGTSDPNDPSAIGQSNTPHKARITVNFRDFKYREGASTGVALNELRDNLTKFPGVSITADKDAQGPPVGKPISIEVTGEEFATLIDITEQMRSLINESGIEGIEKLNSNLEIGKPELIVNIDREKARRFGLSTNSIANEVRTSLYGKEISKFKLGEDDYEIQLRLEDQYRYDLDAIMNKSIVFRNQIDGKLHYVPISSVATAELSTTYGSVRRKDLNRIITLSSNVLGGYNATVVNDQIKEVLANFPMPAGYAYKFGGEQEKQAEEFAFLSTALMLAVFLIFFIIVSQFNKLTAPFIIMTTVLFSTIGVLLGLIIFKMDFVVIMTMIGIISLAGIVVNNAIVLIDFIELIRRRKSLQLNKTRLDFHEIKDAIAEAGTVRLRPVLLTAITTILGLIPLAIGINIDFIGLFTSFDADFYIGGDNVMFWGPICWTIIFGLTFATFLTLIIVPVMYLFFARVNRYLGVS